MNWLHSSQVQNTNKSQSTNLYDNPPLLAYHFMCLPDNLVHWSFCFIMFENAFLFIVPHFPQLEFQILKVHRKAFY